MNFQTGGLQKPSFLRDAGENEAAGAAVATVLADE
jgi:hypothetical protein